MSLLKFTVGVVVLALAGTGCHNAKPQPPPSSEFNVESSMRTLFGNFDPDTHSSLTPVPEEAATDPDFAQKDEIRIRPFFTQSVDEDGVRKVFMLTWAKPAGQPFDCRGCGPLIGAAIFVQGGNGWQVESRGRAVLTYGDFGRFPNAKLVHIGPARYGFLLEQTSTQAKTTVGQALLVPWKNTVMEGMRTVTGDTNEGDCGGAYPCYGNHRELQFVPGANPDYYDIVLTLSGTDMNPEPPYKLHKVSGMERLRFEEGKYVQLERSGDVITAEKAEKKY